MPANLAAKYSLFSDPQQAVDRLSPGQVASLSASGLIMSGTRFLGDAAFGGRIYLVPAQHLLAYPLAPPRCLPQVQRSIEQELLPLLRSQYPQHALCIDRALQQPAQNELHDCAPATGTPYALLSRTARRGSG